MMIRPYKPRDSAQSALLFSCYLISLTYLSLKRSPVYTPRPPRNGPCLPAWCSWLSIRGSALPLGYPFRPPSRRESEAPRMRIAGVHIASIAASLW